MLRNLSTSSYVSLGLSFVLVTIMLVAILLGLVPDRAGAMRTSRATIAETIAANGSAFIEQSDTDRLRTTLRLAVDRNDDLLSAAVRRGDGQIVAFVGDHARHWRDDESDASTSANVKVPIWSGGKRWGRIELRFEPLFGGSAFAVLGDPRLKLVLFVLVAAFFAFRTYLGRVLKHLDPAQAVPPHVRSALDTLAEGLIVVDKREYVVLANEAFAKITGQTAEKLVGRLATDLGFRNAADEAVGTANAPWQLALESGSPRRNEMLHLVDANDIERTFIVNCSPVLGSGGDHAGVLISLDDVTQLEANKVELRLSKDAAEAANLAKSDFLANMSHEIRTPMNAILGFTDVLRRGYDRSSGERRKYLDTIHSSGKHLLNLINDVLDLSKVEAGHLEVETLRVSVHEIAAEVVAVLQVRAEEKGIGLELEVNGEIPETIGSDPTRMRQIVTNLVGNAIKFTETGAVRVVLGMHNNAEDTKYAIRVIDSGIGIEADALESIFDPFVQADASVTRNFGGTGLGLAISRRFARLLGGDIVAHSTVGEGTVFVVTIEPGPLDGVRMLSSDEALAVSGAIEAGQTMAWQFPQGTRVLVVDDGEENRELVQLVLQNVGLEVGVAENGQVAVDQALAHRFDLILMDMQMPVLDGYEATARLREEGLELPIIALTADAMKGFEQKCLAAGCSGYLTKPVDIDALLELLAEQLDGERTAVAETAPILEPQPQAQLAAVTPGHIISTLADQNPAIQATIAKFIDGLEARFAGARQALAAGDLEELARFGHWIKGAGGTVGFPQFTRPAANLEQMALRGLADHVEPAIATLEAIGRSLVRPGGKSAPAPSVPAPEVVLTIPIPIDDTPVVSSLPMANARMRAAVENFLVRLDERLVELDQALSDDDREAIVEISGWLKGASSTVGFVHFMDPASGLQEAAEAGNGEHAAAWRAEIVRIIDRIEMPANAENGKAAPTAAANRT